MKILFICGSLDVGRDGVGDYLRRLAGEVMRQGNEVSLISLNEKRLSSHLIENQISNGSILNTMRIPDTCTAAKRFEHVKEWADSFKADWVSFHFVPYSYDKKGLSFGLGKNLKRACGDASWQIMFHELWIGKETKGDWKRVIVATLQKSLIKKMINDLAPKVIHTHLPVFYHKLIKLFDNVKKLPLYSNIEVLRSEINRDTESVFRVGFFSQVDATPDVMLFLNTLAGEVLANGLDFEILIIGGNEERMKLIGGIFETLDNIKLPVRCTGFISDEAVSAIIQTCTIGITSTPRHALGKGSSVATLIAHGLPVAAPNKHFMYDALEIGFFTSDERSSIITEPKLEKIPAAKLAAQKISDEMQLSKIANDFLLDLKNSILHN